MMTDKSTLPPFVTSPPSVVVKPTWMYNVIILISTLVFFMLPMLIISILYLLIGLQLHRERVMTVVDTRCSFGSGSLSSSHEQKLRKRNLQVTKMLCRCHFSHVFFKLLRSRKLNLNWLCVSVCMSVYTHCSHVHVIFILFLTYMPIRLSFALSSVTSWCLDRHHDSQHV